MSHIQQINFVKTVKEKFPNNFENVKVLEIGSLNINGTVRTQFTNCDYIGIDVGEGEGVDIVCEGQNYNDPDNSFDTTISCECFEHNPYWVETFTNMIRLCKDGGLVLMTCATTGRGEHGTTRTTPKDSPLTVGLDWDYYKNLTEEDFKKTDLDFDELFYEYEFSTNTTSSDLYFYGIVKK